MNKILQVCVPQHNSSALLLKLISYLVFPLYFKYYERRQKAQDEELTEDEKFLRMSYHNRAKPKGRPKKETKGKNFEMFIRIKVRLPYFKLW